MNWRNPAVSTAIGVIGTLVVTVAVVLTLLLTSGAKAVSDNAGLIGALIGLGGVFTTQMVSIALGDRRAQETRNLEAQRAHEASLQNYFAEVGNLLIKQPLRRASPSDELSAVVRAQTLTVLAGLDPGRKRILLRFLYESGLIWVPRPVLSLYWADLSGVDLRETEMIRLHLQGANLDAANFSDATLVRANFFYSSLNKANLSRANLVEANLSVARLGEADLGAARLERATFSGADLGGANLNNASLESAYLGGAYLHRANLRGAHLNEANLREADLREADLREADLTSADLSGSNLNAADLREADLSGATLSGATLRSTDEGRREALVEISMAAVEVLPTDEFLEEPHTREVVDLRRAKGLTQEQIEEALGDDKTKLPGHLKRPASWSVKTDEQTEGE